MKAKMSLTLLFVMAHGTTWACPVCEQQKPRLLRGITHGVPQSDWDWVIVGIALAITLYTLVRSLKLLIRPGEQDERHIKQSILQSI